MLEVAKIEAGGYPPVHNSVLDLAVNLAAFKLQPASRARRRLAIVSTYDDLCGIAGYTRALEQRLEKDFDVHVFDLDQFFMRSSNNRVRALADRMILDICGEFSGFDVVNIQLEYGTLGRRQDDMVRRFDMLASAAPELSVTFHTILTRENLARWKDIFWMALTGRWRRAREDFLLRRFERTVGGGVIRCLRRLQKTKSVSVIVHTRRDARLMKYVNGIRNVFDHPLAFLGAGEARKIREETRRQDFPTLAPLSPAVKIIGVFGFLSEYKGVGTAIRALRHLPAEYHLAIFGGVHPNEIRREPMNEYVAKLLAEIRADASIFDDAPKTELNVSVAASELRTLYKHPKSLAERVHFMGAQSDDKFAAAMAICDVVVLSYHEVGQSSSGPLSIAVEMGCRVIATRNHAFLQFDRYMPGRVEFFDIGNHLELAERLRAEPANASCAAGGYDCESNAEIYRAANGAESLQVPGNLAPRPAEPVVRARGDSVGPLG